MNEWMTKYHLIFLKMMHFTLIFDRMMVAMMSIFYSLNIKENAMQSHKLLTRRFYFGINFVSNKLILYCAQRCDLIRFCLVTEMAKLKLDARFQLVNIYKGCYGSYDLL